MCFSLRVFSLRVCFFCACSRVFFSSLILQIKRERKKQQQKRFDIYLPARRDLRQLLTTPSSLSFSFALIALPPFSESYVHQHQHINTLKFSLSLSESINNNIMMLLLFLASPLHPTLVQDPTNNLPWAQATSGSGLKFRTLTSAHWSLSLPLGDDLTKNRKKRRERKREYLRRLSPSLKRKRITTNADSV